MLFHIYCQSNLFQLHVFVMPRTRFKVNPHSRVTLYLSILAKWLTVRLRTKWFWVRVQLQSLNLFQLVGRILCQIISISMGYDLTPMFANLFYTFMKVNV